MKNLNEVNGIERRILEAIRAVGERNHEAERRYSELKETVWVIMLVAAIGIWSRL